MFDNLYLSLELFPLQVQQQDLGTPSSGDVDDWDDKAALMAKQVPFIVGKIKLVEVVFFDRAWIKD